MAENAQELSRIYQRRFGQTSGYRNRVWQVLTRERDLWVRANLFAVEGHWGQGNECDLVLGDPRFPARSSLQ